MKRDPIIEEIHRVRRKMLADCGGDIDAYFDRLQEDEALDRDRLVSKVRRSKKRAPTRP